MDCAPCKKSTLAGSLLSKKKDKVIIRDMRKFKGMIEEQHAHERKTNPNDHLSPPFQQPLHNTQNDKKNTEDNKIITCKALGKYLYGVWLL